MLASGYTARSTLGHNTGRVSAALVITWLLNVIGMVLSFWGGGNFVKGCLLISPTLGHPVPKELGASSPIEADMVALRYMLQCLLNQPVYALWLVAKSLGPPSGAV